ncbi:atp-binding cassette sub-family g member 2-like, partial [Nannochloropsis oceanica]
HVCDQVRRLDRQISYGGSVHVQEMGYLARSFMNSAEGKAIAAECEARVVESGGVVDKDRKMDKHIRRYATGFPHQFRIVSQRVFVAVIRNPATSVFQVLSFVASAVLLGAFFQGRLNGGPTAMQAHIGAMFMVAYMIIFSAITSLELFIEERALFVHEKTSGFYRTSAYFLAKIACEILPTRMIPTLFYALITAFMAGLRTDFYHLAMYWLTLTVTSITSTSLCLLVSCATSVYSAAFLGCGAFYIIFMLASGFVLQADEIPSYLAPFKYLSFYRYCLQNLLALDLKGRTFDCPTPEQLMADPTLVSICLPSGDMYLQSQGIDPDNLWRNIGILAAMAPVYLLIAYLFLRALKKTT